MSALFCFFLCFRSYPEKLEVCIPAFYKIRCILEESYVAVMWIINRLIIYDDQLTTGYVGLKRCNLQSTSLLESTNLLDQIVNTPVLLSPEIPQILADQLTLSQPREGGRLCPPNNIGTPDFQTFLQTLIQLTTRQITGSSHNFNFLIIFVEIHTSTFLSLILFLLHSACT